MNANELLWTEDDCTRNMPGHEGLDEAWLRLFGTALKWEEKTAEIDHGDVMEYQFPNSISVFNVYGAYYRIERRE